MGNTRWFQRVSFQIGNPLVLEGFHSINVKKVISFTDVMKAVTFFLLMGQAMPCLLEGQWGLQARGPHLESWAIDAVKAAIAFSPCTVWVLLKSSMAVASKFCSGSQGPILSQAAQIYPGSSCQWVAHVRKRANHSNHLSILVFCALF